MILHKYNHVYGDIHVHRLNKGMKYERHKVRQNCTTYIIMQTIKQPYLLQSIINYTQGV